MDYGAGVTGWNFPPVSFFPGEKPGRPILSPGKKLTSHSFQTLTSSFMFHAYSGQGNLRLAEFFPTPLTICTTVFPHVITLCIELMFNLVRVGKEWAGPVFPHTLKSKGYMCIRDRVRLAVFFRRRLTRCTTVFPHLITFCLRLMFNLVRVGKEWAGPVSPNPLKSNFMFYAYSGQGNLRLAEISPPH